MEELNAPTSLRSAFVLVLSCAMASWLVGCIADPGGPTEETADTEMGVQELPTPTVAVTNDPVPAYGNAVFSGSGWLCTWKNKLVPVPTLVVTFADGTTQTWQTGVWCASGSISGYVPIGGPGAYRIDVSQKVTGNNSISASDTFTVQ